MPVCNGLSSSLDLPAYNSLPTLVTKSCQTNHSKTQTWSSSQAPPSQERWTCSPLCPPAPPKAHESAHNNCAAHRGSRAGTASRWALPPWYLARTSTQSIIIAQNQRQIYPFKPLTDTYRFSTNWWQTQSLCWSREPQDWGLFCLYSHRRCFVILTSMQENQDRSK